MTSERVLKGGLFLLVSLFSCLGYEVNVNCGADDSLECGDITWQADRRYRSGEWGYLGGEAENTMCHIDGSSCCEVHNSFRRGMAEYRFDVAPGWYKIDLHFSENRYHGIDFRRMDVLIEGEAVLEDLDIYARAGKDFALPFYLFKQVIDGCLNIEFNPIEGEPIISGISVLYMESDTTHPLAPFHADAYSSYYANLIRWDHAFTDRDLAGFHVYRTSDSLWSRITDEPWNLTFYIDREVFTSRSYRYRVSAVDVHGNESLLTYPSEVVSPMFIEESHLPVYELDIEEEDLFALNIDPHEDDYIRGDFRHEGVLWEDVRIRYRGGFTRPSPKKSWKINFFREDRFYGIDKINLNSEYLDITMMRNNLGSMMFKGAGIDAPELSYANMWLNGSYMGIFLQLEQIDDVYLDDRDYDDEDWIFKNEGSNFDDFPYFYEFWDIETGDDEDDYSHLGEFLRILNETPDSRFPEVFDSLMDMEAVLRYFAINSLIDETDFTIHNHYLHRIGETGKWHIIPWDNNLAFHNTENPLGSGSFYYPEGMYAPPSILYTRVISVDEYRCRYCDLIDSLAYSAMDSREIIMIIDSLQGHIHKDIYADYRKPHRVNSWFWDNEVRLFADQVNTRVEFVLELTEDFREGITDSPVLINELCVNNTTYPDEYGEYDPWVELYNRGDIPFDLGDLILSDSPYNQRGERLPSIVLEPGEKRIIWLDRQPGQGEDHIDMHVYKDGGFIGLFDATRPCFEHNIYPAFDLLFYGEFDSWRSWQRYPDASQNWSFSAPTPGGENSMNIAENIPSELSIAAFPNPFNSSCIIEGVKNRLEIMDIRGRIIDNIDLGDGTSYRWRPDSGLESGIYLARSGDRAIRIVYVR